MVLAKSDYVRWNVKYLEGLFQRILHKLKLDLAEMYHGCVL